MRRVLIQALAERTLLCDGAMGTMLQQAGLSHGDCPEQWNLTHPDVVAGIHAAYFDAGSDIVLTNTFGATPIKLALYHLADKTEEFNRAAVRLARKAAGSDRYVLGDMGSCGGLLEPYGDLKPEEAEEAFLKQASALAQEDLDGIIIETMTDLEEMKLALKAARQATSLPVIVSMSYQNGAVPHRTLMGQKTTDCALALKDAGASVIGSNCGVGSAEMLEIIREIHAVCGDTPLIAQSNAGLPVVEAGKTIFPETPQDMAVRTKDFLNLGIRILGGCCGTSPEHIRALRQALDENS